MKKLMILSLAVALVGLAMAPVAFAGITGSRHDMTNPAVNTKYGTSLATFDSYGACSACHIPHGAGGARLFPKTVAAAGTGFFGPLCQTCHDSTVVANSDLNTNATVLNGGHGLSITTLAALGNDQTVPTSGLPYTGSVGFPVITAGSMECMSCHDVHNQKSFRPFLQLTLDNLCETCHSNRVNNVLNTTGFSNTLGTHPSGPLFTGDMATSGMATAPNSPLNTVGIAGELAQNPDVATTGSTWTDVSWNSGLQLSSQGAQGVGGVDCITCHNVHWDENDTVPNNGTSYLAAVDDNTVYAVLGGGAANALANNFCEFCHRGAAITGYAGLANTYPNPGGTGYTHPNDSYSLGNGIFMTINTAWRPATSSPLTGTGTSGLVCTSCHGVHRQDSTTPQTKAMTPNLLNYGANTSICNACHTGFAATFNHHPVGTVYATAGNNANGVSCAGGDLALGINKCHGQGGGNGTRGAWYAHNRLSPIGSPVTNNSQTCLDCHTNNPSTYSPNNTYTSNGTASHFVGDAAASTWRNGRSTAVAVGAIRYANSGSSLGAATNWSLSNLPSKFGANATTLICESCHRLAQGNLRTGDGATALMLSLSGAAVNGGDPPYNYATNPYICSGCHLIPGGTHPLATAEPTAYTISALGLNMGESYTAQGLNCESCHSAHNASTTSGSYILDGSTLGTYGAGTAMQVEPVIDYTRFCAVCHNTFQ